MMKMMKRQWTSLAAVKKKVAEESTALDQANAAIKRDKAAEKARHDRMRDLARTQDARSRNQETK